MSDIQGNQLVTTLSVEGMSCEHCVRAVEGALRGVGGVEAVSVNLEQGTAEVRGNADVGAMVQAVAGEGYTMKPLKRFEG